MFKNNKTFYIFLLLLIIFFQLYCFNPFAPELNNNVDLSNVITEQQTPGEVLQNFRYAYTFKDSLLYSDVLDDSFVFEYFDTNSDHRRHGQVLHPAHQGSGYPKYWIVPASCSQSVH